MTDTQREVELPAVEEIRSAFDRLFGDDERGVRRFKQSGLRYVKFPGDITLIEQNPNKQSQWAELAQRGRHIAWLMKNGEYLARVVDGEVEILKRRAGSRS